MGFLSIVSSSKKIQALQSSFVALCMLISTLSVFSIDPSSNAIDVLGGTESVKLENIFQVLKKYIFGFFLQSQHHRNRDCN